MGTSWWRNVWQNHENGWKDRNTFLCDCMHWVIITCQMLGNDLIKWIVLVRCSFKEKDLSFSLKAAHRPPRSWTFELSPCETFLILNTHTQLTLRADCPSHSRLQWGSQQSCSPPLQFIYQETDRLHRSLLKQDCVLCMFLSSRGA